MNFFHFKAKPLNFQTMLITHLISNNILTCSFSICQKSKLKVDTEPVYHAHKDPIWATFFWVFFFTNSAFQFRNEKSDQPETVLNITCIADLCLKLCSLNFKVILRSLKHSHQDPFSALFCHFYAVYPAKISPGDSYSFSYMSTLKLVDIQVIFKVHKDATW